MSEDPKIASIGLVGCSSMKRDDAAPARLLYASPLFRSALALAEARHEFVYIISAKYELVTLDQEIEPYEKTIADLAKEWRAVWGTRVWGSIMTRHRDQDRQVTIYAGKEYASPIIRAGFHQATFQQPLARLQVGQRLRWLSEQLRAECAA